MRQCGRREVGRIRGTQERKSDRRTVVLFVALLLAALLVACGPTATPSEVEVTAGSSPAPDPGNRLAGSEWVLVVLNGSPLLEGTHITLKFDEASLGGFAGCNSYGGGADSGGYTATEAGGLEIPMLAITAMACPSPEGVMEQEQAYVEALGDATAYEVDGTRLVLRDGAGEAILEFARQEEYDSRPEELPGTSWQLVSMDGQTAVEGSTVTLAFHDEHRLGGATGCRDYVAVYQASGDDLGLLYMAMLGAVCSEMELQEQEGLYTTMLDGPARYRLVEGDLEIVSVRGETLLFELLAEEATPDLDGTSWSLLAFIEPNPAEDMPVPLPLPDILLPGSEITLVLEGGAAQGSASCNTYWADIARDGNAFTFGNLAFTEMACLEPEGVMEQEDRYLYLLRDIASQNLYGGQLWLETEDGRSLVFRAEVAE
jgi:heat shock protein HslJ